MRISPSILSYIWKKKHNNNNNNNKKGCKKIQSRTQIASNFWREKSNLLDKMRENKAAVLCLKADAIYFAVKHLGK